MSAKEAQARIKINKLLEDAGWRFFEDERGPANIALELHVKMTPARLDALGDNLERAERGFVDFLLLDERGFPLAVLEAKSEDKNPLVGKEQARRYARSQNCRFVILSNGNLHYFWDLEQGNPHLVTRFPAPDSVASFRGFQPNPQRLVNEPVGKDYIALTQMPEYYRAAGWVNAAERAAFTAQNQLAMLRDYQLRAVQAIQQAVSQGASRFLFEMATGTGKTLVAAAVIKLFLRTGNAHRVLFLVDRLELEDQARKVFGALLKNDYTTVIYKERRDDWRKAEIVVTTVQSLLYNNKYERLFSPTDFDLVISDEAHRSIGGDARAVFEYFVGYKLGLTATPKDYLKQHHSNPAAPDPRELERRLLLDTYRTFGCESGQPTFRYSLLDGARDGYLILPTVVDARTEVTTQLLSERGYAVAVPGEGDESIEMAYGARDFEKEFYSEATNRVFCEALLANALRDPISGEIGKTIVFAVSQNHAAKLTQILNELADRMFPGKYRSDFAVQVTSQIPDAQQFTLNFTGNSLMGQANFDPAYRTSKARVCVTVGMMTTGYDCPDILNLALMRPIYSPSEFVQIKGRGTRRHNFAEEMSDLSRRAALGEQAKARYKLFDFFANCEYFEEKYDYDEVLKLPAIKRRGEGPGVEDGGNPPPPSAGTYDHQGADSLTSIIATPVGLAGMKIDRMFFDKFESVARMDPELKQHIEAGRWEQAERYVAAHLFDKPEEYFNLAKLRQAAGVDRRITLREILEKVFGLIPAFRTRDELLDDEFDSFMLAHQPGPNDNVAAMRYFFKCYALDGRLREIIASRRLAELNVDSAFSMADFRAVPDAWRERIMEYIKDRVSLNQFI